MYHHRLTWHHNGLTRTIATYVQCAHGANTDSFDPVEVRIHGPFSMCKLYTNVVFGIAKKCPVY